MKVATCLHGLARGSSVKADGAFSENYSTLLEKIKDTDVFIHCWDTDIEEHLLDIFNPVGYFFEPQKTFKEEMSIFDGADFSPHTAMAQGNLFKTLSFLYSRKKAIELKSRREQSGNFVYDAVLVSRFDVGHHKEGQNKTSHLNFDPNFDMTKMYQAYWDQTNAGASDHWFYSNSKNIDMLSKMYENVFEYLKTGSKYSLSCSNGWPISDLLDEFSGELFKEKRSTNLAKYTNGQTLLINNHCLYKFHLMGNKMWENGQSVFLNQELWDD
jgi:hypothetical protein